MLVVALRRGPRGLLVRAAQSMLRQDQQPLDVICSGEPSGVDRCAWEEPMRLASAHRAVLLLAGAIFGRCTAVAELETTAHAASTSVFVQSEEQNTALAHMGHLLPHFPVLDRPGPQQASRAPFWCVHRSN